MSLRLQKVGKEVQELIGHYLSNHFPYKNEVIITISNVVMSPDLKQAKVYYSYFSPLETDVQDSDVKEVLEEEKAEMQSFINRSIKMKFTPKLHFYFDESIEENFSVIEKLRDLGYAKDLDPSDDV